jgi:hypothetical protein
LAHLRCRAGVELLPVTPSVGKVEKTFMKMYSARFTLRDFFFFFLEPPRVPRCPRSLGEIRPLR